VTTEAADPGTDGPPADDPEDVPADDVPLFSSYQGVSESSIDFGIAAIDAAALLPFGFDLGQAPVEDMYVAWTDAQSARGGVRGRNLVPHTRPFLPIGTEAADAICAEFAEDIEVFAVTGRVLGDTALEGRFFATEMAKSARRHGGVTERIAQGDLDGTKVALRWENPVDVAVDDLVRPLLVDAEVEIDLESKETVQALVDHCRAFRLMVLIFEAAGVDLTPDSFVAGAESLGSFSLPAMPGATLGPDNHAAGSQIRRYEYDASVGDHLPVGEAIDAVSPG
jgi:hypothetical protein